MKSINRWILAVTGIWLVQLLSAQQLPEIRMVDIPAGSFYMGGEGTGEDYDELPIHKVNITHPFKMSMTEITNAQFEAFRPEHKALRGKNGLRPWCTSAMRMQWLSVSGSAGKKENTIVCLLKRNGNMPAGQVRITYIIRVTVCRKHIGRINRRPAT